MDKLVFVTTIFSILTQRKEKNFDNVVHGGFVFDGFSYDMRYAGDARIYVTEF